MLWFLLFAPAAGDLVAGNELNGSVLDPSGAAVPAASVQLLDSSQFVAASTQTDGQGRFTIPPVPPGTYELLISSRGFDSARIALSMPRPADDSLEVILGLGTRQERVTVTADLGLVQDFNQSALPVNAVDDHSIKLRAKAVLAQVAQEEEGLQLQRTSPTIGAIFVRGLTGAKVVTFIDGIRFSTSTMRGGINTFFNLNESANLRAVEVVRGPSSAQYGSDSLGGAVQLLSKMPSFSSDRPETHSRVSTFFNSSDLSFGGNTLGSYGQRNFSMLVNLSSARHNTVRPGGGIDSHAAVTRFLGISSDVFGERMSDTAFTQYGGMVRLHFRPAPTHQFTVHYQRGQQDGGKRYDQTLGGDGNLIADLRNLMLDFFYVRYEKSRAGWFDNLTVSYSLNTQREERVNQGGNGNPNSAITHQREHTFVNGAQFMVTRRWGSSHDLAAGAEFYNDLVRAPAYTLNPVTGSSSPSRPRVPDRATYRSGGAYFQDVWAAIPDRLRLTAAFRYGFAAYRSEAANSPLVGGAPLWPDDELRVNSATPRFGALLSLGGGLSLSAQVSRGFRAPGITDLGTLGLTGNGYEVAYADLAGKGATIGDTADSRAVSTGLPAAQLVPESSWNYEAGLHFSRNHFSLDVTGFLNDISDNIAVQTLLLPQGAVGTRLGDQVVTHQLPNGAVFVDAATNPVLIRSNFDDARIVGLEQRLEVWLSSNITITNTFTYLRAEDRRTGLPPNIEGGTPAPQGWLSLYFRPLSGRIWIEPYAYAADRQARLSSLDLSDRRTGASRSRNNIRNFFFNGATVRGLIGPGPDQIPGTADDVLLQTGETLSQVQNRVLGVGVAGAPLMSAVPGFFTAGIRGGVRWGESQDLVIDIENLTDRNYRGISWGMDAPGRGISVRYSFGF